MTENSERMNRIHENRLDEILEKERFYKLNVMTMKSQRE